MAFREREGISFYNNMRKTLQLFKVAKVLVWVWDYWRQKDQKKRGSRFWSGSEQSRFDWTSDSKNDLNKIIINKPTFSILWNNVCKQQHSCSGVRGKNKTLWPCFGSYRWVKKYFSVYVQKMPKKAKFIAIRYFNFFWQHW